MECEVCKSVLVSDGELFCSECYPDTCYKCSSSSVSLDNDTVSCSHGCQYDVWTYISHSVYTTLLNGSWRERLRLAGNHIEYIISDPSVISISQTKPSKRDGFLRGIHFTPNPSAVCSGYDIQYQEDHRSGIRDESAYAWPYTKERACLMWGDTSCVWFQMPENEVVVSSYRFFDWIGGTGRWSIPQKHYTESLTFTPNQLFTIVSEESRPEPKENFVYFTD